MEDTGARKRKADPACMGASDRPAKHKRSADEVTHAQASAEEMPAQVWGHVMDYLPYTDVLACLLVNRLLSFEAPAFVKELHVFKSCELNPEFLLIAPTATKKRRFVNVIDVSIFCLLRDVVHWSSENPRQRLCADVIDKVVPFLQAFPKLIICWMGGWDENLSKHQGYDEEDCIGPEDHSAQYRRLIESFSEAFEREALPQPLILECFKIFCRENVAECEFCERVCATFPLSKLIELYYYQDNTCFFDEELLEKIKKRNWNALSLRQASSSYLSDATLDLWHTSVGKSFFKAELEKKGAENPGLVYHLTEDQRKRIQFMMDHGIVNGAWGDEPEPLTKELVLRQMTRFDATKDRGYALTKTTFDLLVRAGYPLDSGDFVVIDESRDEALEKRIDDEISGDHIIGDDAKEEGGDNISEASV